MLAFKILQELKHNAELLKPLKDYKFSLYGLTGPCADFRYFCGIFHQRGFVARFRSDLQQPFPDCDFLFCRNAFSVYGGRPSFLRRLHAASVDHAVGIPNRVLIAGRRVRQRLVQYPLLYGIRHIL